MRRTALEGWQSMYSRGVDGAIDSDERVRLSRAVVPSTEEGARELGERYWAEVRRATFGLVRASAAAGGSALRVVGIPLLLFGTTELESGPNGISCRFPISGGLIARRPGGVLVLSQSADARPELRAALVGFVPRLGNRPYDRIQRRIHVRISRCFFVSLLGEGLA